MATTLTKLFKEYYGDQGHKVPFVTPAAHVKKEFSKTMNDLLECDLDELQRATVSVKKNFLFFSYNRKNSKSNYI